MAWVWLWQIRWALKVKFKWPWSNAMNSARRIKFVGQYVIPCATSLLMWPPYFLYFSSDIPLHFPPTDLSQMVSGSCCCSSDYGNSFGQPAMPLSGFWVPALGLCWPFTFMAILAGSPDRLFGRLQLINWPVMSSPRLTLSGHRDLCIGALE